MAGMAMIITLAFFLALGILSVILSCSLFGNWLPLINVVTYLLAPIPNAISKALAGNNDFFQEENQGVLETGYFITSFFVISGFGLPLVLYHAGLIEFAAMLLSLCGGLLIYGTVIGYKHFFIVQEQLY
jgi:hypothetical protein